MSGKMRAALDQFSNDVMKIRVGEAPTKNLGIFRKKTNDFLFLRFYNIGYFEGGL